MKFLIISFLMFVVVVVVIANGDSLLVKYKDICEKVDVDFLLKNKQIVSTYMKCLLNKSHCNREGLLIRDAIPEILTTVCANCTEKQKYIVRRAMNLIYTTRNADFERIYDEFDPKRIYRTAIMNFMFNNTNAGVGADNSHNQSSYPL